MPFLRPTYTTLRDQGISDILSAVSNKFGLIPGSLLKVTAQVLAAFTYLQYGFLDWIALQSTPVTATDDRLLQWAALVGITRNPPVAATGTVTFTGSVPTTLIPGGSSLTRSDAYAFFSTADATVASNGSVTVNVQAVTPGSLGNTDAGVSMSLTNGLAGIVGEGTVVSIGNGSDMETDASLRSRMLFAFANPPSGGDAADYERWALNGNTGVTRTWIYPEGYGAGTVVVYVMFDGNQNNGFATGTAGTSPLDYRGQNATGDLSLTASSIYPLQPVTATVYLTSPTPSPVNITISNLSPSTVSTRAAVTSALQQVFTDIASPMAGATIVQSQLEAAIFAIGGINSFTILNPVAPIVSVQGQLPICGTVTFQ